jgi:sulfur-oxidizing protein SoxX
MTLSCFNASIISSPHRGGLMASYNSTDNTSTEEAPMRQRSSIIKTAASVAVMLGSLAIAPVGSVAAEEGAMSVVEQGKDIAFNRKKGNCLACHQIEGGSLPGNIGPPLVAMKARFPEKAKLRAQIWDSTKANPASMMPPFGRHKILSEAEIDKVVEFIYTL